MCVSVCSMADIVLVNPTSTGCHSKVVCRSGVHEAQNIISTEVHTLSIILAHDCV